MEQATLEGATPEQPTAQPPAAPTREEVATAAPTREEIAAAAPTREEVIAAAPPPAPSSGAVEGVRAPSPAHVEEPSVEARTLPDAPDLGKGSMASSTMVGRSVQGEGAQAGS
jgi:hypothetical protein